MVLKDSIPKLIGLKSSMEIIKSLRIMLNNTIISNENDVNRSNLVNYALNNVRFYPISYRNMNKATGTISLVNNKFISNSNYASDNTKRHEIAFKIPTYLKDISDFFRNIRIINCGEFNINLSLIDKVTAISISRKDTYKIKNAYLIVEEIQLNNEDNIKYLKMLNNGYEKKINFMEDHVKIFDEKINGIDENFHINNVSKSDSVFIYGITDTRKTGLQHDLPNVGFENLSIQIDSVRFENPINNDISAFEILRNKSNHPNDFLITYNEFVTYYRIFLIRTGKLMTIIAINT